MSKFVVVCVLAVWLPAIIVADVPEEMKELIDMLHKTCVAESGVSEDLITKVNTDKAFPDDENLKCYVKCLMSQTGCISDDGVMDPEAVVELLPEPLKTQSQAGIRKCGAKVGANPCDSAWLTHKCYLEANPTVYELI